MLSEDDYSNFESDLKLKREVNWIERQSRLVRIKRDYISEHKYSNIDYYASFL